MRLWWTSLIFGWLYAEADAFSWPFITKKYRGNSLLTAGSMGLTDDGRVVAFGDFNGDQFLDILTLGDDQQTLTVYLWNHEDIIFKRSSSFHHPSKVLNVIPGDFTYSGLLDLLVMSESSSNRDEMDMLLYPASSSGGFKLEQTIKVPSSTRSQPIPIDMDGDMKIDLLGITPSSKSDSSPFRVWQNVWNTSDANSPLFDVLTPKFDGSQCTLSDPHSNAVIDLNGDCLADVFLVCDDGHGGKTFQIWVNNKDDGFSLAQQDALPSGVQAISFADIDRDGTIDMVFPTCASVSSSSGIGSDCYLNIAYNQQLPLCASTATSGFRGSERICRPPDELCTADPHFKFDLRDASDNDAFVRIPVSDLFLSSSSSLLVLDTSFSPPLPLPIKLGDSNLDGFPDILAIAAGAPRLVFSVPCGTDVVGCNANNKGRRGWKVARKGAETLDAINDARGVAFLDMDEDGTLDVMIQRTGKQGEGKFMFIQNNFYYDAFFLKAIVLNGACGNGWCTDPNASERYHPFGVSYSGATYKYTVLDTSGGRAAAQIGQLPQTSYQSLLTPYAFFGLGRTNNYIENLFVGSTKHSEQHFINMEGVIPNSRVVILPPSQAGDPWKRELFLRPGDWIPWVTVTVVVGTGILAIIVFVLHLNEKREDELERRRASHHINFDAL